MLIILKLYLNASLIIFDKALRPVENADCYILVTETDVSIIFRRVSVVYQTLKVWGDNHPSSLHINVASGQSGNKATLRCGRQRSTPARGNT